jgi:ankyrin repeat protein
MRRAHWLIAMATLAGGCNSGAPEITAREIFPDTTAAALAEAAAKGDTERVRRLIAAGADPNARGRDGVTVSQWALMNQSPKGLAALLEGSADPALADSSGETVVHYAAKANVPLYLEVLLKHGADPNTPNGVTRATPLVPALMANRDENFRMLMAAGADPNAPDRMGDTPLHVAAKINAFARVLDLLAASHLISRRPADSGPSVPPFSGSPSTVRNSSTVAAISPVAVMTRKSDRPTTADMFAVSPYPGPFGAELRS